MCHSLSLWQRALSLSPSLASFASVCVCFLRFTRCSVQKCTTSTHQSSTSSNSSRTLLHSKENTITVAGVRHASEGFSFRFVCVLTGALQFSVEFLMDKYGRTIHTARHSNLAYSACNNRNYSGKQCPSKTPFIPSFSSSLQCFFPLAENVRVAMWKVCNFVSE